MGVSGDPADIRQTSKMSPFFRVQIEGISGGVSGVRQIPAGSV